MACNLNNAHYTLIAIAPGLLILLVLDPRRPALAFKCFRMAALLTAAIIMLLPFIWLACAIFKKGSVLMEYTFLPPISKWDADHLGVDNFIKLFTPRPSLQGNIEFWQYLLNSLFLASAATVIQMVFASMGGYALAKYRFQGQRGLMLFMLGSMMIPPMLFLAPVYNMIVKIGWVDHYWALLVPRAVSAFGILLHRQAMQAVPDSLLEAARGDGASELYIYYHIVMPLVRPMTSAFCLIVFMGQWNNFIGPQVFVQTGYKLTVPVVLNQYVSQYGEDYGIFLAGTFLSMVPVAILFFALQKEVIRGLTAGAVKG